MPHRIPAMMDLMFCALATVFLAAADTLTKFGGEVIYDKTQLRVVCFIGASIGALINILSIPSAKNNGIKPLAAKWVCSWGVGVAFTPVIMRYFELPADVDMAGAVSTAAAIAGVSGVYWVFAFLRSKVPTRDKP